jgi:beta-phosphoglucomutase
MIESLGVRERSVIRAVIFDMDGVLTDSEPLINAAAIAMFREKGLVVQPADFLPFVGTGEDRYIGGVAAQYQFPLDLPSAKARTYEIYLELVPKQLQAFPGAVELVRACRQSALQVAVASSADRVKIEANLRQIGLLPDTWDTLVVGEDVVNKKPAPDIFLSAAAKLGRRASECVVIEDALNGVDAAKAAGMRCVAVAQTFSADRLQKADLVRRNLGEVVVADLLGSGALGAIPVAQPIVSQTPESAEAPARKLSRRWGFWSTVGLTLVILLAALMAQVVAGVIWAVVTQLRGSVLPANLGSNGLLLGLATCASAPVVFVLAYLLARIRMGPEAARYLGLCPFAGKALIPWTIALVILVALSDALTVALGRPIVPNFLVDAHQTAGFLPLLWFALIVAAPLAEEVLFRGFAFQGILTSRLGGVGAVTLTSLIWALIHLQYDFYGIFTIFVSGLLLGYVRLKTGSIYLTMLLHALMNLIATIEVIVVVNLQH